LNIAKDKNGYSFVYSIVLDDGEEIAIFQYTSAHFPENLNNAVDKLDDRVLEFGIQRTLDYKNYNDYKNKHKGKTGIVGKLYEKNITIIKK
jgi:hypothetical protein